MDRVLGLAEPGMPGWALNSATDELLKKGIYVIGFFFPVVPKDKARIRVQLSAAHTKEHLDKAISAFIEVGTHLKII